MEKIFREWRTPLAALMAATTDYSDRGAADSMITSGLWTFLIAWVSLAIVSGIVLNTAQQALSAEKARGGGYSGD